MTSPWRLALAVVALSVAVPSARAQTVITFTTAPEKHTWLKPRRADGFKPTKIKPGTRAVLIEVPAMSCVRGELTRVRRTKTAVTITLIVDVVQPADGPYGTVQPSCPLNPAHVKKVRLKGRLGHRVVKDGATRPTKTRYP
jgi:hypothetical protein